MAHQAHDGSNASNRGLRDPQASTGLAELDAVLGGGLNWGDNVVWEASERASVEPFYRAAASAAPRYDFCRYVSFERDPNEVREAYPDFDVIDARPGTDLVRPRPLLTAVYRGCERSQRSLLLFDPLETVAERWGAEAASLFFTHCCPHLLEVGAIAYWSFRQSDLFSAVRRDVEDVTQCVFEVGSERLRIAKAEGHVLDSEGTVFRYRVDGERPALAPAPMVARLGEALRAVRVERALTQGDLAAIAGVSANAISQAERGKRGLSVETLYRLAHKLSLTVDELLGGEVARGYRLARRLPPRRSLEGPVALLDDPRAGLRAFLVRIPARRSAAPHIAHKGKELVAVGAGLVQTILSAGRPVLRPGEALLVEHGAIEGWRNLGTVEALVFWILRDEP